MYSYEKVSFATLVVHIQVQIFFFFLFLYILCSSSSIDNLLSCHKSAMYIYLLQCGVHLSD